MLGQTPLQGVSESINESANEWAIGNRGGLSNAARLGLCHTDRLWYARQSARNAERRHNKNVQEISTALFLKLGPLAAAHLFLMCPELSLQLGQCYY